MAKLDRLQFMPKKLKRVIAQIVLTAVALGIVQGLINVAQDVFQLDGVWKPRAVAWLLFGLIMIWKFYQLYVGLYRDGSFFYDEDES